MSDLMKISLSIILINSERRIVVNPKLEVMLMNVKARIRLLKLLVEAIATTEDEEERDIFNQAFNVVTSSLKVAQPA